MCWPGTRSSTGTRPGEGPGSHLHKYRDPKWTKREPLIKETPHVVNSGTDGTRLWNHEAITSLLRGTAVLGGLCDEVRGSDIRRERLAELLPLHVERSRWRRLLIRISREHTQEWARNVLEGSCMSGGLKIPRGRGSCRAPSDLAAPVKRKLWNGLTDGGGVISSTSFPGSFMPSSFEASVFIRSPLGRFTSAATDRRNLSHLLLSGDVTISHYRRTNSSSLNPHMRKPDKMPLYNSRRRRRSCPRGYANDPYSFQSVCY